MERCEDTLSARDFARLSDLVHAETGIRLRAEKKTMLEGRLRGRLRALDFDSYKTYCAWLLEREGFAREKTAFIDAVTTNKTDFFREPRHFDLLAQTVLPDLQESAAERPLLVWSAACSSGEEPYTLAMVLSEYAESHPGLQFRLLATDICTEVLAKAELGVYASHTAEAISPELRRKYLMRSRIPGSDRVRIVPELRRLVEFRRLNLMESDYALAHQADAIFCRNVLIYFDRATQEAVLRRLSHCLRPHGYLFVGHSETLHSMDLPLAAVAPALYRKTHDRS
ncbi:MAG TPA: protein-glutamate O-methyltransferase CheR [Acidobacteriaceae bacterium]